VRQQRTTRRWLDFTWFGEFFYRLNEPVQAWRRVSADVAWNRGLAAID
jgi:hypothetical protein